MVDWFLFIAAAAAAPQGDGPTRPMPPRAVVTATASVTIIEAEPVKPAAPSARERNPAAHQFRQRDGAPLIEFY